jgi:hypothetical protein
MRSRFSKAERQALRQLVEKAYTLELDEALRDLDSLFTDWRTGRIDGFALADAIHHFHQGPAQELWSRYAALEPDIAVRFALYMGTLDGGDVPPPLLRKLQDRT